MVQKRGGFLIRFDEQQRTALLQEILEVRTGFSDALSTKDWPLRRLEVCGLMFEPDVITHWALARRTRRVATAKSRVEFLQLIPTTIQLALVERVMQTRMQELITSARTGIGGRIP